MFEISVQYILMNNFNNIPRYRINDSVIDYITDTFSDDQLDEIGNINNIYLNNLCKREKAHILASLYNDSQYFDRNEYVDIINKIECRQEYIKNKFKENINLPYIC